MCEQQPKHLEENLFGSIFLPGVRAGALGKGFVVMHFQMSLGAQGVTKYEVSSLKEELKHSSWVANY
jgi:hypothetical protein